MTKLQIIINQLENAKSELKSVDLQENELVYDYVFEALRLAKELNKPVSELVLFTNRNGTNNKRIG